MIFLILSMYRYSLRKHLMVLLLVPTRNSHAQVFIQHGQVLPLSTEKEIRRCSVQFLFFLFSETLFSKLACWLCTVQHGLSRTGRPGLIFVWATFVNWKILLAVCIVCLFGEWVMLKRHTLLVTCHHRSIYYESSRVRTPGNVAEMGAYRPLMAQQGSAKVIQSTSLRFHVISNRDTALVSRVFMTTWFYRRYLRSRSNNCSCFHKIHRSGDFPQGPLRLQRRLLFAFRLRYEEMHGRRNIRWHIATLQTYDMKHVWIVSIFDFEFEFNISSACFVLKLFWPHSILFWTFYDLTLLLLVFCNVK